MNEELESVPEILMQSYALLYEHAADGIYFTDLDGLIDAANPRYCAMLGLPRAAVVGQSCGVFQAPEDRAQLRARLALVRRMTTLRGERTLLRADGTTFPAEVSSQILPNDRILVIVRDITERRRAEEALRQSEKNFRVALGQSPDAVVIHVKGRVRFVNEATLKLLGTTQEDMLARNVLEWTHPDDREEVRQRLQWIAATGAQASPRQFRLVDVRGETVEVESHGSALTFDGESALLSVLRDIRPRKHIERQLLISERMASVGVLAAGIAHEINNPLFYLTMNLEHATTTLREHGGGPGPIAAVVMAELEAALGAATDGAQRVCEILKGLKAFSRIEEGPLEPVDVRRAVDLALRMAENEVKHRATLKRSLDPVPLVNASESRLGQVVLNLVVNASQSIAEGKGVAEQEIAVATYVDEAGRVVIEVRDTGCGIAPEVLGRIFEPFFTTKAVGAGTGLGLSICHGIVKSLGGEIAVVSKVGVGSTFRISLPALIETGKRPPPTLAPPTTRRGRVLVIDDEPVIAATLLRILSGAHDVEAFTRADDAVERIRAGERFDAVLCDLMMPGMTGMDAFDAVRAIDEGQSARMVFVSGGAFTERSRAFAEAHRVVSKPLPVKQIREIVNELVGRERGR